MIGRGLPSPQLRSRWRSPAFRLRVGLFAVLLTWTGIPIAWAAQRALRGDGSLTGAVGLDAEDQLAYLAWVRDASHHLLIGNLFGSAPERVLVQPMYLASGLLVRLGITIAVSMWLWALVAVVVIVIGIARFGERFFPDRRGQQIAFAIVALCPLTPLAPYLFERSGWSLGTRTWIIIATYDFVPAYNLWGLTHIALTFGLMALFVLRLEQLADATGPSIWRSKTTIATALIGGAISWSHSWQGLTLLVMMGGLVLLTRGRRALVGRLALPIACTLLPLAYFSVLVSRYEAWHVLARQNQVGFVSITALVVVVGPFVLLSAFGLGDSHRSTGSRLLLLWLGAAAAVYIVDPEFRPHALIGVSIPLAVLCVRAWPRGAPRPVGRHRVARRARAQRRRLLPGAAPAPGGRSHELLASHLRPAGRPRFHRQPPAPGHGALGRRIRADCSGGNRSRGVAGPRHLDSEPSRARIGFSSLPPVGCHLPRRALCCHRAVRHSSSFRAVYPPRVRCARSETPLVHPTSSAATRYSWWATGLHPHSRQHRGGLGLNRLFALKWGA